MSVNFSGLVPNNYPFNSRIVVDASLVQNVALPNASNTAYTNAIDLVQATPYPVTETINVQVIVGAATGTANSKNINACIQQTVANTDGTPNSAAWTNVTGLAVPLVTTVDNAGTGAPAGNAVAKLQPGSTRFIRGAFTTEANGGATVLGTGTLQLLF